MSKDSSWAYRKGIMKLDKTNGMNGLSIPGYGRDFINPNIYLRYIDVYPPFKTNINMSKKFNLRNMWGTNYSGRG